MSSIVPEGPVDKEIAWDQVMALHSTGKKPLHEPMLTHLTDVYVSMG